MTAATIAKGADGGTEYLQPTATQMRERTLTDHCAWCGAEPHKDGCFCRRCPACGEYWKAVSRVDYSDGLPALKECPGCEGG